jgi:hypothetical protein
VINLSLAALDRYVGRYRVAGEGGPIFTVSRKDRRLYCDFQYNGQPLELVPHSEKAFSLRWTAGDVDFDVRPDGSIGGLTFALGGDKQTAAKVE